MSDAQTSPMKFEELPIASVPQSSKKRSILEIVEQELQEESSKRKKVEDEKSFSFMNNTFQKLSLSSKPRISDNQVEIDAG